MNRISVTSVRFKAPPVTVFRVDINRLHASFVRRRGMWRMIEIRGSGSVGETEFVAWLNGAPVKGEI